MTDDGGLLGKLSMAATSLYVSDLGAAVDWYRETLNLEPEFEGKDSHGYATYRVGGALLVLEPKEALLDGRGLAGSGAATLNLVSERDPADVRDDLMARGVQCSDLVDSPGFRSFLFRDLDDNRFYVTKPTNERSRQGAEAAADGPS